MSTKLDWTPPKGLIPFQEDVAKHADHDQRSHGNWARGQAGRVSVRELLDKARPTDHSTWDETFAYIEREHVGLDTDYWGKFQEDVARRGVQTPIILDEINGVWAVISGHHRIWAARRQGEDTKVPVLWADSEQEAYDLMLEQAENESDWITKHYGPGNHPGTGTGQEVHAGVGVVTVPIEGIDNTLSALPPKTAKAVEARTLEYLGTEEEIKANLRSFLDSAAERGTDARYWYEEHHDWGTQLAEAYDQDPEDVLAATAAMSSGMNWEANMAQTELLTEVHATNPTLSKSVEDMERLQASLDKYAKKYELTPVKLTSRTKFSGIKDPYLAAVAYYEISKQRGTPFPARYGYSTLADSISIFRGADPDDVLTGIKRRSFFNNLLANPRDDNVTIDVQMLQAANGAPFTDWRTNETENILNRAPSISRTVDGARYSTQLGVRPLLADYVRDLTTEYNERSDDPWSDLLPRQTQAIIWAEYKERLGRWGEER